MNKWTVFIDENKRLFLPTGNNQGNTIVVEKAAYDELKDWYNKGAQDFIVLRKEKDELKTRYDKLCLEFDKLTEQVEDEIGAANELRKLLFKTRAEYEALKFQINKLNGEFATLNSHPESQEENW